MVAMPLRVLILLPPSTTSVTYTRANYNNISLLLEGTITHHQSREVFGAAARGGLSCDDSKSLSLLGQVSKPIIDHRLFVDRSSGRSATYFATSVAGFFYLLPDHL